MINGTASEKFLPILKGYSRHMEKVSKNVQRKMDGDSFKSGWMAMILLWRMNIIVIPILRKNDQGKGQSPMRRLSLFHSKVQKFFEISTRSDTYDSLE